MLAVEEVGLGGSGRAPQEGGTIRWVQLLPQDIALPLLGPFLLPDLHSRLNEIQAVLSHRTAATAPDMPFTIESIKIHNSISVI